MDDGFVIKASATTGKAAWIKHYPESNRDAQVVGVDVDASGNVFGSGYSCSSMVKAPSRERHSSPPWPPEAGNAGLGGRSALSKSGRTAQRRLHPGHQPWPK